MSKRKRKKQKHPPLPTTPPARYEDWLMFFFGRLRDDDDPFEIDWQFDVPLSDLTALLSHMLENAATDLAPYSDQQLAMGLEALFMPHHTDISFLVSDKHINRQEKARLVRALKPFYIDFLAHRCAPALGHLDEAKGHRLGFYIYMLWDVSALAQRLITVTNSQNSNSILVEIFGEILLHTPANPACLESILHGLGHMVFSHPEYAQQINWVIDSFLINRPNLRPELMEYAQIAKTGCIQ